MLRPYRADNVSKSVSGARNLRQNSKNQENA